jgi:hypothetical protein
VVAAAPREPRQRVPLQPGAHARLWRRAQEPRAARVPRRAAPLRRAARLQRRGPGRRQVPRAALPRAGPRLPRHGLRAHPLRALPGARLQARAGGGRGRGRWRRPGAACGALRRPLPGARPPARRVARGARDAARARGDGLGRGRGPGPRAAQARDPQRLPRQGQAHLRHGAV